MNNQAKTEAFSGAPPVKKIPPCARLFLWGNIVSNPNKTINFALETIHKQTLLKNTTNPIMKQNILAISGKPGLYLLVARGNNTVIVESMDGSKKRFSVGLRDRITSLNDVSIYTDDEDVKLTDVFESMKKHEDGKTVDMDIKKASKDELAGYVEQVLPNFDRDRVYPNDMRKLITWYNILVQNGITEFADPEEEGEEKPAEA